MSWDLQFEFHWRDGGEVPASTREAAARVLKRYLSKTKYLGLVVMEPSEAAPLRGSIQILNRDGNDKSFAALLEALQQIARLEPNLLVKAWDDYSLEGEDVLSVGEVATVTRWNGPDPTNGAETFRAHSVRSNQVYLAALPKLNAREAARSFLHRLTAKKLIEWCGPDEPAIERLAALIEEVNQGRWHGSQTAFAVLEKDSSVEEIHATDRQLDELWRTILNHS